MKYSVDVELTDEEYNRMRSIALANGWRSPPKLNSREAVVSSMLAFATQTIVNRALDPKL